VKPFALLLLTLLAGEPVVAEIAPRVNVALAPTQATVGDPITATLVVRLGDGDDAATVRFPDWSQNWGDARVLEVAPPQRRSAPGGSEVVQVIRLAAYRTGVIELPAKTIEISGDPPRRLTTPGPLHFEIRSVLPESGQAPQPRKPAEPRPLPIPIAFWWAAGALAAALVATLWTLRRRRSLAAAARALPSPFAELEAALAGLASADPVAGHAALSLALRRYLGRSFSIPAAESTTSELGRRLEGCGFDREPARDVVRLLREVDPIKFARQPAGADELRARVAVARRIAEAVRLHLSPPREDVA